MQLTTSMTHYSSFHVPSHQASRIPLPLSSSLLACFEPRGRRRRRRQRADAVARHIVIIGVDPAAASGGENTFLLVPARNGRALGRTLPFQSLVVVFLVGGAVVPGTGTGGFPYSCSFYYASLIPFSSLLDAISPLQQLMATINTVNFDDLFDFSPEPLELQSSPNPHSSNAVTAAIPRSV